MASQVHSGAAPDQTGALGQARATEETPEEQTTAKNGTPATLGKRDVEVGDLVSGYRSTGGLEGWYNAVIAKRLEDGSFLLDWEDGDANDRTKIASKIKPRNRPEHHEMLDSEQPKAATSGSDAAPVPGRQEPVTPLEPKAQDAEARTDEGSSAAVMRRDRDRPAGPNHSAQQVLGDTVARGAISKSTAVAAAAVAKNPVNASVLNPAHSNTQPLSIITSNPPEAPVAQYAEAAVGSAQNKQPMGGAEGMQSLRECPFQAGHPSGGSVTNDVDLSDDYIRSFLKVEVSHESCNMIRTIHNKLRSLVAEGICRYTRGGGDDNCVWGFRVLEVEDPVKFNQAFRAIVPPGRDNQPLKRPTEVFMKTLRFCGVTARRGSRGPKETDPDPRDFMYSFYYDYVSSKEEYNRRKLCMNGYSKEAREIAAEHRGQFLERDLMPKRTKRATEERERIKAETAATTGEATVGGLAALTLRAAAAASGLDALFAAALQAEGGSGGAGGARGGNYGGIKKENESGGGHASTGKSYASQSDQEQAAGMKRPRSPVTPAPGEQPVPPLSPPRSARPGAGAEEETARKGEPNDIR